ncbi:hypothetical protein N7466_006644 [Penicillium verhagenii]|uniref:uncharacterized protein n=1 Tax=Penicillium verhagenii TaxID=1562060 RepID=UPI0025455ABE|nr:uncharacterized protein N7466_006644 [Penicillium verhagenii]KAJ5931151.1 hypothetical protein N7466_006644 [Penicillium verhagenii]
MSRFEDSTAVNCSEELRNNWGWDLQLSEAKKRPWVPKQNGGRFMLHTTMRLTANAMLVGFGSGLIRLEGTLFILHEEIKNDMCPEGIIH